MDSDEELYRFFEEKSPESPVSRKKSSSNGRDTVKESRTRRGSGDSSGRGKERKRRSSGESGLRARLGRKMEQPRGDKRAEKGVLEELDLDLDKVGRRTLYTGWFLLK